MRWRRLVTAACVAAVAACIVVEEEPTDDDDGSQVVPTCSSVCERSGYCTLIGIFAPEGPDSCGPALINSPVCEYPHTCAWYFPPSGGLAEATVCCAATSDLDCANSDSCTVYSELGQGCKLVNGRCDVGGQEDCHQSGMWPYFCNTEEGCSPQNTPCCTANPCG
jgi:hypothetical protein